MRDKKDGWGEERIKDERIFFFKERLEGRKV